MGLPKTIQSNQGSNCISHLFQQVMHELNIKEFKDNMKQPGAILVLPVLYYLQYWYYQYYNIHNTGNTSIVNITILVIQVL